MALPDLIYTQSTSLTLTNWQKRMGLEPGTLVRLSTDSKRYEGYAVVKESNLRCVTVAYQVDSQDIELRILKGLISTAEDITHIHITEVIDDGPAVIYDAGFKANAAIIDEPPQKEELK